MGGIGQGSDIRNRSRCLPTRGGAGSRVSPSPRSNTPSDAGTYVLVVRALKLSYHSKHPIFCYTALSKLAKSLIRYTKKQAQWAAKQQGRPLRNPPFHVIRPVLLANRSTASTRAVSVNSPAMANTKQEISWGMLWLSVLDPESVVTITLPGSCTRAVLQEKTM